jgi:predicted esterase
MVIFKNYKPILKMKVRNIVSLGFLLICFFLGTYLAIGQDSKKESKNIDSISFESPILLNCKIILPFTYDSNKPIDLVINLHSSGGNYENFHKIWRHFENPQFIMASPEAPYKLLMGDKIRYDWFSLQSGNLNFMIKALELTSTYIENLIISLKEKYAINRVYLLGVSQGGLIAQIAGIKKHALLDGIIMLNSPDKTFLKEFLKTEIFWPSNETIKEANNLNVFIVHGKSDANVDIKFAYKSKDFYIKNGYNTQLFEFEGGHGIYPEAMREIEKWINNNK